MEPYRDLSRNSGVSAYEEGADYITVFFKNSDKVYKYTYRKPGKKHVEKMKQLARQGKGLSTYISQHVGSEFESVR